MIFPVTAKGLITGYGNAIPRDFYSENAVTLGERVRHHGGNLINLDLQRIDMKLRQA